MMMPEMQNINTTTSNNTLSCDELEITRVALIGIFHRKCCLPRITYSNIECAICRKNYHTKIELTKHLHSHLNFRNRSSTLNQIHDVLLEIQVTLAGQTAFLEMRNIGHCDLMLGHIYWIHANNAALISFTEHVLQMGKTLAVTVEKYLINSIRPNTIIIQAFKGELEFFLHIEQGVCCGIPDKLLKPLKLKRLEMCKDLTAILTKPDAEIDVHFKTTKAYANKVDTITYQPTFLELSMVERIANQLELNRYCQPNVTLIPKSNKLYEVAIKNVKDTMNRLSTFDTVEFTNELDPTLSIVGNIYELLENKIVVQLLSENINTTLVYNMEFHLNGYTYDMESTALQLVHQEGILHKLFPSEVNSELPVGKRDFKWFNVDITSNQMQMQAVRHIVEGTSYPAPYILFGPPGTGKTKTLVEAISQIHMLDENSRMLVCATSNAAADELAIRIIENLPNECWIGHHVYRIYSKNYAPEAPIEDALKTSSNFDLKYCPDLEFLQKFRIIVATLLVGGSLRYAKLSPAYFTHLFLDECGSATELSSLVAIACAAKAKIVLSGDPKQLGPVVFSKHASDLGLGLSMLERLMDTNVYQKLPESNSYNANVITKLVHNYRSHPTFIAPSNRLFYEGDLIASAHIDKTHCFVNWKHLPCANTPIIFHACNRQSQRDHNSPSIFNMREVWIVVNYVELVMQEQINGHKVQQSDIGIISPYRKQCYKLKEELSKRSLCDIMVATVEMFQGREKPIILVSTARCKMGGIGFLRSPKRLNVLLTRAQCLMIIVGDPNTLTQDKNWRVVLTEFQNAGVCTGIPFVVHKGRKRKNKKQKSNGNHHTETINTNQSNALLSEMAANSVIQSTHVKISSTSINNRSQIISQNNQASIPANLAIVSIRDSTSSSGQQHTNDASTKPELKCQTNSSDVLLQSSVTALSPMSVATNLETNITPSTTNNCLMAELMTDEIILKLNDFAVNGCQNQ